MCKRFYGIVVTICLLAMLSAGSVLAAEAPIAQQIGRDETILDGKAYYLELSKEFQDNPIVADVNGLVSMPIGKVVFNAKIQGIAPDAHVCKTTFTADIDIMKKDTERLGMTSYMEQKDKDLIVYSSIGDGKWSKQIRSNMQVLGAQAKPVDNERFIKSVEVLNNTPEYVELKIKFDFTEISDVMGNAINSDQIKFKNEVDKAEFMELYNALISSMSNFDFVERVNKADKSISVDFDLAPIIKGFVNVVTTKSQKLTADDQKMIKEFVDMTKANMQIKVQILEKTEKIKIPGDIKRNAKEIKQTNHKKPKIKVADTVE